MENIMEKSELFRIEVEQAVLSTLMLDEDKFDLAKDLLSHKDFYLKQHQDIFKTLDFLYEQRKGVDSITLTSYLMNTNNDRELSEYVFEMIENAHNSPNFFSHIEIVKNLSTRRRIFNLSNDMKNQALNKSIKEEHILDAVDSELFSIMCKSEVEQKQKGGDYLRRLIQRRQDVLDGKSSARIKTGYSQFDEMTGGLDYGSLVIVGARPSVGKTTFSLNLIKNIAIEQQIPSIVFSLEMRFDQIQDKLLSSMADIKLQNIRNSSYTVEEEEKIARYATVINEDRVEIYDNSKLTVSKIRSIARRTNAELAKKGKRLELIFVDYITLIATPPSEMRVRLQRNQEIEQISQGLKSLAKELNIVVIAAAQLNRNLESRADKRPMLSDLKESGSLEQDADLVLLLHREERFAHGEDREAVKGKAEVIIAKNREGQTGIINMKFIPEFCKFVEVFDG